MFFGYNTNGMAHHDLFDAIRLLAEIGYRGVAITLDHAALPPYGSYGPQRTRACAAFWTSCRCDRSWRPAHGFS